MNLVILTGISNGLGKALHDILVCDTYFNQYLFVSRKKYETIKDNTIYIDWESVKKFDFKLCFSMKFEKIIFINNAFTIEPINQLVDISIDDLESAINSNCIKPITLLKNILKVLEKNNTEILIFNISSGAAKRPIAGWLTYCMSKAAMKMALDVIAKENNSVSVIHYDPGVIDTSMQSYIREQTDKVMPDVGVFNELYFNNLLKKPEEVAVNIIDIIKKG